MATKISIKINWQNHTSSYDPKSLPLTQLTCVTRISPVFTEFSYSPRDDSEGHTYTEFIFILRWGETVFQ